MKYTKFKKMDCNYGMSLHEGVIVVWDEDYDKRVLIFLNEMAPRLRKRLMAVQEREGHLVTIWKSLPIPSIYNSAIGEQKLVNITEKNINSSDTWTVEGFLAEGESEIGHGIIITVIDDILKEMDIEFNTRCRVRALNCCARMGIDTIEEFMKTRKKEFMKEQMMGKKTYESLSIAIDRYLGMY